jgi:signal transduction histidine kinase
VRIPVRACIIRAMATARSAPARGQAGGIRGSDTRLWQAALAAGLLLCVAYAAVPVDRIVLRDLVIYTLAELIAILAIVVGVRLYRPQAPLAWLLIAGGLALWTVGDLLWSVYELAGRDPFPSLADVFYLDGYPLLAAALFIAFWRRSPGQDHRPLIDAAIVAVSATLLAWVYIVEPARADTELGTLETLVSVAYPFGDILVLAVAVRFILGSSWNVPALRLLVLGLGLTLFADIVFALDVLALAEDTRFVDTMLLVGIVFIGVAGLHPSMTALTEESDEERARADMVRLTLVACVCLVPLAVLAVQAVRDEPLYLAATISATVVLVALVVIRLVVVTEHAQRAADREASLRRYASDVLSASGREELFALAERAGGELAGPDKVRVAEPGTFPGAFAAPVLVRGERTAELTADVTPAQVPILRDSLTSIAAQLSLALERERLLATEREAAQRLAEQNERLRELDRMKDQFVSVVSHELRTPLTSMVGYLELVLEGEAGELSEEQEQFLGIVERNCRRLNDLVDEILFVARVDAGRLTLERESVDLTELAEAAVTSARVPAERKGVEISLSASNDLPALWADPTRLTQVLDNLLSNAVKFTPAGGTVRASVARRGDGAHVEVADTGVGIPKDEVGRLFERFFRASTAATIPGTGLGLSIVKAIVEAHGGRLSVESEEGVGTTFCVDLPLEAQPEPAAPVGATTEVAK